MTDIASMTDEEIDAEIANLEGQLKDFNSDQEKTDVSQKRPEDMTDEELDGEIARYQNQLDLMDAESDDYGFLDRQADTLAATRGRKEGYRGEAVVEGLVPFARQVAQDVSDEKTQNQMSFVNGEALKDAISRHGNASDETLSGYKAEEIGAGENAIRNTGADLMDVGANLPLFIGDAVKGLRGLGRRAYNTRATDVLIDYARDAGFSDDVIEKAKAESQGDPEKMNEIFSENAKYELAKANEIRRQASLRLQANEEGLVSKIGSGALGMIPMIEEFATGGKIAGYASKGVKAVMAARAAKASGAGADAAIKTVMKGNRTLGGILAGEGSADAAVAAARAAQGVDTARRLAQAERTAQTMAKTWKGRLMLGLEHSAYMTPIMGSELARRRWGELTDSTVKTDDYGNAITDANGDVTIQGGDEKSLGTAAKAVAGGFGEAAIFSLPIGEAAFGWASPLITKALKSKVGAAAAGMYANYVKYGKLTGLRGQPVMQGLMALNEAKDQVLGLGVKDAEYKGLSEEWDKFCKETLTAEHQLDVFLSTLGVIGAQGAFALHNARSAIKKNGISTDAMLKTFVLKDVEGADALLKKMSPEQKQFWRHWITARTNDKGYALDEKRVETLCNRLGKLFGDQQTEAAREMAGHVMRIDNTDVWGKYTDNRYVSNFMVPFKNGGVDWKDGLEEIDGQYKSCDQITCPRTGITISKFMPTDEAGSEEGYIYIVRDRNGNVATRKGVKDAVIAAREMDGAGQRLKDERGNKRQALSDLYQQFGLNGENVHIVDSAAQGSEILGRPLADGEMAWIDENRESPTYGHQFYVLDKITNPLAMRMEVLHEVGRHRGLEVVMPDDASRTNFLIDLVKSNDPVVRNQFEHLADLYGFSGGDEVMQYLDAYQKQAANGEPVQMDGKISRILNETWAHIYDTQGVPAAPGAFDQHITMMRKKLRGLFHGLPMSRLEADEVYRGAMEELAKKTGGVIDYVSEADEARMSEEARLSGVMNAEDRAKEREHAIAAKAERGATIEGNRWVNEQNAEERKNALRDKIVADEGEILDRAERANRRKEDFAAAEKDAADEMGAGREKGERIQAAKEKAQKNERIWKAKQEAKELEKIDHELKLLEKEGREDDPLYAKFQKDWEAALAKQRDAEEDAAFAKTKQAAAEDKYPSRSEIIARKREQLKKIEEEDHQRRLQEAKDNADFDAYAKEMEDWKVRQAKAEAGRANAIKGQIDAEIAKEPEREKAMRKAEMAEYEKREAERKRKEEEEQNISDEEYFEKKRQEELRKRQEELTSSFEENVGKQKEEDLKERLAALSRGDKAHAALLEERAKRRKDDFLAAIADKEREETFKETFKKMGAIHEGPAERTYDVGDRRIRIVKEFDPKGRLTGYGVYDVTKGGDGKKFFTTAPWKSTDEALARSMRKIRKGVDVDAEFFAGELTDYDPKTGEARVGDADVKIERRGDKLFAVGKDGETEISWRQGKSGKTYIFSKDAEKTIRSVVVPDEPKSDVKEPETKDPIEKETSVNNGRGGAWVDMADTLGDTLKQAKAARDAKQAIKDLDIDFGDMFGDVMSDGEANDETIVAPAENTAKAKREVEEDSRSGDLREVTTKAAKKRAYDYAVLPGKTVRRAYSVEGMRDADVEAVGREVEQSEKGDLFRILSKDGNFMVQMARNDSERYPFSVDRANYGKDLSVEADPCETSEQMIDRAKRFVSDYNKTLMFDRYEQMPQKMRDQLDRMADRIMAMPNMSFTVYMKVLKDQLSKVGKRLDVDIGKAIVEQWNRRCDVNNVPSLKGSEEEYNTFIKKEYHDKSRPDPRPVGTEGDAPGGGERPVGNPDGNGPGAETGDQPGGPGGNRVPGGTSGVPKDGEGPVEGPGGGDGRGSGERPSGGTVRDGEKPTVKKSSITKYVEHIPGLQSGNDAIEEPIGLRGTEAPMIKEKLDLPQDVIDKGLVRDFQALPIIRAKAAAKLRLPTGEKTGTLVNYGTGTGKSHIIVGAIEDGFANGQRKHLVISPNKNLMTDLNGVFGLFGTGRKAELISGDTGSFPKDGVGFATYSFLGRKGSAEQLAKMLGKDFDGIIAFDECQMLRKEGGARQEAAIKLQAALPNATVIYSSATPFHNPKQMGYMTRCGLWGDGTDFKDFQDFATKISGGGKDHDGGANIAAGLEKVARSMKMRGISSAYSLSDEGVTYKREKVQSTQEQVDAFHAYNDVVHDIFDGLDDAMRSLQNLDWVNGGPRGILLGFHQRMYNTMLASVKAPMAIEMAKRAIARGKMPVFSAEYTGESAMDSIVREAEERGESIDASDLDVGPKEVLLNFLDTKKSKCRSGYTYDDYHFPTHRIEIKEGPDGDPVVIDHGVDPSAEAIRQKLIKSVKSLPDVFGNPITQIIDALGKDKVANLTGLNKKGFAEDYNKFKTTDDFNALIFSKKANAGFSFHTHPSYKNNGKQRVFIPLQSPWSPIDWLQSKGRVHRVGQISRPEIDLVETDFPGESRFISSIASREGEQNAMTMGDRNSGRNLMNDADNFSDEYARRAIVNSLGRILEKDGRAAIDDIARQMLFLRLNSKGEYINDLLTTKKGKTEPEIGNIDPDRFFNRLLSLSQEEQTEWRDKISRIRQEMIKEDLEDGVYDPGLQKVDSVKDEIISSSNADKDLSLDHITSTFKTKRIDFDEFSKQHPDAVGEKTRWQFRRNARTGQVFAIRPDGTIGKDKTMAYKAFFPDGTVVRDKWFRWANAKSFERIDDVKNFREEWNANYEETPEMREEDHFYAHGDMLRHVKDVGNGSLLKTYALKTGGEDGYYTGDRLKIGQYVEAMKRFGLDDQALTALRETMARKLSGGSEVVRFSSGWRGKTVKKDGQQMIRITNCAGSKAEAEHVAVVIKNRLFTDGVPLKDFTIKADKDRVFLTSSPEIARKMIDAFPADIYERDEKVGSTNALFFNKDEQAGDGYAEWLKKNNKKDTPFMRSMYDRNVVPLEQKHTSAGTSLAKNEPTLFKDGEYSVVGKPGVKSPLYNYVKSGDEVLDIGAGKTTYSEDVLKKHGIGYAALDPFNRDAADNKAVINGIENGKRYPVVTAANLLNVLDTPELRSNVILQAAKALKPNGHALFDCYQAPTEGERGKDLDNWQTAMKPKDYLPEIKKWFGMASVDKNGIITASMPKPEVATAKAEWKADANGERKYFFNREEEARINANPKLVEKYIRTWPAEDRKRIYRNFMKLSGTPWQKATTKAISAREEMERLLKNPKARLGEGAFLSEPMQEVVRGGEESIFRYLSDPAHSIIGHAAKPVLSVAGSMADCNPSKECAKFCYTANGRGMYPNVIAKAELGSLAIRMNPKRAADITAAQFKAQPGYFTGESLRLLDRGDLSKEWVEYVKGLNENGVRAQIFSKRPEILRQIGEGNGEIANTLMLSVDASNYKEALKPANADLPVAVVWRGPEDNAILEQFKNRFVNDGKNGVVLPIMEGQRALSKEEIKQVPSWARQHLCPIDAGWHTVKDWNCQRCDAKDSMGVGCFFKHTSKALGLDKYLKVDERPLIEQQKDVIINKTKEIEDAIRKIYPGRDGAELVRALGDLRDKIVGGHDPEGPRGLHPKHGGAPEGKSFFDKSERADAADVARRDDEYRGYADRIAAAKRAGREPDAADVEQATRLVREAAAKAGYKTAAWHGTELEYMNDGEPWSVFDDLSHFGTKGQADLVSQSKSKETGGNKPYVYSVYLDLKNSKRVPDVPNDWNDTHSEYWYAQSKKAIDEGYDSIVYKNDYESKRGGNGDSYLPFYHSQIKSADPVTYDDAGNVIPLSKRFDRTSPDIRFFNIDEKAADRVGAKNKDEAEKMLLAGEDRRKVWEKTGWWKAPDGKWRYEIRGIKEDEAQRVFDFVRNSGKFYDKDKESTSIDAYSFDLTKLENEMKAAKEEFPPVLKMLMTAYPRLKTERMVLDFKHPKTLDEIATMGYSSGKEIRLYKGGMSADTFNHEIQHKMQEYGGMARGTNPTAAGGFDRYQHEYGEWEARLSSARAKMTDEERKNEAPWETKEEAGIKEADTKISDINKARIRPDGKEEPAPPAPPYVDAKRSWKDKYMVNLTDRYYDILKMERENGRKKGDIFVEGSPYNAMRLLHGQNEKNRMRYEMIWKRPFEQMLKKGGITADDVGMYMMAKDVPDRNKKVMARNGTLDGSGMSDDMAKDFLRDMEQRLGPEKWKAVQDAANHLWKMQDEGLKRRVQSGRLDQATYDKWRAEEPFHVPMRDDYSDEGEPTYSTRQWKRNEFKTAEGRKTISDSPVEFMLKEYQEAMYGSNENEARKTLGRYVMSHPELGKVKRGVRKGKAWSFTHGQIEEVPDPFYREQRVNGGDGKPNLVAFKDKGNLMMIDMNGDLGTRIAAAVIGRDVKRAPGWYEKGLIRPYASTATELSPTFIGRNFTADMLESSLNTIADKGLLKGGYAAAKNIVNAVRFAKTVWKYNSTGRFEGNGADILKKYVESGASIGGVGNEGVSEIRAEFENLRKNGSVVGFLKHAYRVLSLYNKQAEIATRLSVFKDTYDGLIKEGKTEQQALGEAAMRSREYSTDFNKYGNQRWMNSIWMFSGSVIGSGVRQIESLARGKHGVQLATALVAYGAIESLLEHFVNADEDEKNRKEGLPSGDTMTEYQRANSLYFRMGDKYARIPFHAGPFSALKYLGNTMMRMALGDGNNEELMKNVYKEFRDTGIHFTGTGDAGPNVLQSLFPTLLVPFFQHASNEDFAGRPIKRKMYSETKPYSENGRAKTGEGFKWAARYLNEMTGGSKYRRGAIDAAPETLEHIWNSLGKNASRDLVKLYDTIANMANGEFDVADTPYASDFVRSVSDNTQKFYEAQRKYEADLADQTIRSSAPSVQKVKGLLKEITEIRHWEAGERKTDGKWVPARKNVPERLANRWKSMRLKKQQKVIELIDRLQRKRR